MRAESFFGFICSDSNDSACFSTSESIGFACNLGFGLADFGLRAFFFGTTGGFDGVSGVTEKTPLNSFTGIHEV